MIQNSTLDLLAIPKGENDPHPLTNGHLPGQQQKKRITFAGDSAGILP